MNDVVNDQAAEIERLEDQLDSVVGMLARIESANSERVPAAVVDRLSDGEAPVRVWREHRGMDREALAHASGVDVATITAIEDGSEPSLKVAVALARALRLDAEDLVPWRQD